MSVHSDSECPVGWGPINKTHHVSEECSPTCVNDVSDLRQTKVGLIFNWWMGMRKTVTGRSDLKNPKHWLSLTVLISSYPSSKLQLVDGYGT